jgi:hypothetical protein
LIVEELFSQLDLKSITAGGVAGKVMIKGKLQPLPDGQKSHIFMVSAHQGLENHGPNGRFFRILR